LLVDSVEITDLGMDRITFIPGSRNQPEFELDGVTLQMKTLQPSDTSATIYHSMQRHISQDMKSAAIALRTLKILQVYINDTPERQH
jgi:hypothetical protein